MHLETFTEKDFVQFQDPFATEDDCETDEFFSLLFCDTLDDHLLGRTNKCCLNNFNTASINYFSCDDSDDNSDLDDCLTDITSYKGFSSDSDVDSDELDDVFGYLGNENNPY